MFFIKIIMLFPLLLNASILLLCIFYYLQGFFSALIEDVKKRKLEAKEFAKYILNKEFEIIFNTESCKGKIIFLSSEKKSDDEYEVNICVKDEIDENNS